MYVPRYPHMQALSHSNRRRTSGPDPVLLISDFLPAEAIEADPTRAYPLLLADYRRYLDIGVEEMALGRKMRARMVERMGETHDSEFMYEVYSSDEEQSTGSGDSSGSARHRRRKDGHMWLWLMSIKV